MGSQRLTRLVPLLLTHAISISSPTRPFARKGKGLCFSHCIWVVSLLPSKPHVTPFSFPIPLSFVPPLGDLARPFPPLCEYLAPLLHRLPSLTYTLSLQHHRPWHGEHIHSSSMQLTLSQAPTDGMGPSGFIQRLTSHPPPPFFSREGRWLIASTD